MNYLHPAEIRYRDEMDSRFAEMAATVRPFDRQRATVTAGTGRTLRPTVKFAPRSAGRRISSTRGYLGNGVVR